VLFQHYEIEADGLCTQLDKPLKKKDQVTISEAFQESFKKGKVLCTYAFRKYFLK